MSHPWSIFDMRPNDYMAAYYLTTYRIKIHFSYLIAQFFAILSHLIFILAALCVLLQAYRT